MTQDYKSQMTNTYKDIYKDRYNLNPSLLKDLLKICKMNLNEMNISLKKLTKMNVLNIGTGVESVVLHILGANKVFHRDISNIAVKSVIKHKQKYKRLDSDIIDVCREKLNISEKVEGGGGVDLIFLCGVFHHFNKPKYGLQNLIDNLNYKGYIYIKNYSSGSLQFFVADFLRKFYPKQKQKSIQKSIEKKYGKLDLNRKNWKKKFLTHLYCNCGVDDSCVPTLNLFDGNEFQDYLTKHNFKNLKKRKYKNYFHKGFSLKDLDHREFIFQNLNKNKIKLRGNFPKHIDQLSLKYRENYIKKTVNLMKNKLRKIKKSSLKKKTDLLVSLIYIANVFRYHKTLKKINHNFFNTNIKNLSTAKGVHYLLQKELIKKVL